jgi:hypothetical protein
LGFDPTPKPLESRLLLGYAMDAATPIEDRSGINEPYLPTWIDILKDTLGYLIVWIIKSTQQNSIVQDVVVDV